jgi:hypothetical protein
VLSTANKADSAASALFKSHPNDEELVMDGEVLPEQKKEEVESTKPIKKSEGVTPTERLLARLCDDTFLKVWAYPNPFNADSKELCDLIVVFEDDVFIFFDRESHRLDNDTKDISLNWKRWEKEVITKQIATAKGAENYLRKGGKIFLDAKGTLPFPINVSPENMRVHKIVVAHGAEEACKKQSPENVYGSLAICYADKHSNSEIPFLVDLSRDDPVHVLDGFNLEIVLKERDTIQDFRAFLRAKEEAIAKYEVLMYCGEEDLLAHYFHNYDEANDKYRIGPKEGDYTGVVIPEGEWSGLIKNPAYARKKAADKESYMWDRLLQLTGQNALDGKLITTAPDWFNSPSALREMAKEPRLVRRHFAQRIANAIDIFPDDASKGSRHLSVFDSYYSDKRYAFLQLHDPKIDYDDEKAYAEFRKKRREVLAIACGVLRNRDDKLTQVIGIVIDAPKHHRKNSEDFLLVQCAEWTEERRVQIDEANKIWKFLDSPGRTVGYISASEFPLEGGDRVRRIGRNAKCPCKSGRKYKNCCGKN